MSLLSYALAMAVSLLGQMCVQPFLAPIFLSVDPLRRTWSGTVPDPFALLTAFPMLTAMLVLAGSVILALQAVVQTAPFAAVYRELRETSWA